MPRQDSIRRFVLHPFVPAVLFVAFSLGIGEFYPFSNFPMYGNPSPAPRDYYYLTDGADEPIPALTATGLSASKVKKIFNSRLSKFRKEQKIKKKRDITDAHRTAVGEELLAYIRSQTTDSLPPKIKLVRVLIHTEDKTLREEKRIVAAEG